MRCGYVEIKLSEVPVAAVDVGGCAADREALQTREGEALL